tara:strand:- start:12579 stop:13289 length:711 start_codon:yes stop_codon:yes gene_type:complete
MDVTEKVLNDTISYGSSGSTQQEYVSVSKSLNFSKGSSLQSAAQESVTCAGYSVTYSDSIGLFGAENRFIKFNIDIVDTYIDYKGEDGWDPMSLTYEDNSTVNGYDPVIYDTTLDLGIVNDYHPAIIVSSIPRYADGYVGINLENLKTNNKYIDSRLDVRLYNRDKQEHPFDKMYVNYKDEFYIGVHARDTKRLPYNIKCTVGTDILSFKEMTPDQRMKVVKSNYTYSPVFKVGID